MGSPPFTFLQTSDWHVGSALTGRGLGWPAELRALRRGEVDGAPERAVAAARACEAEALVVPGDLWDAESAPATSIHRLLEALASFAPRPVFVAPGNHDFAGAGGFYDPSVLAALGMRAWPENVVVFRSPDWSSARCPGRDDVVVTGRAFLSPAAVAERPLSPAPSRPEVPYALLLLHGSLESYGGLDSPNGIKRTAPFSRAELLGAGFSWAALGHHHHLQIVEDDTGAPRAAYSGCPSGRGLDETGGRSFLKVTLLDGAPASVEAMPADERSIRDFTVDASDVDGNILVERLDSLFVREGVGTADIVRVTLTGAKAYGARPASALDPLTARVKHLVIRDHTSPPRGVEAGGLKTAEDRFAEGLVARLDSAPDESARRVVELALALGRDALAGRSIRPPDVEEW